MKRALLKCLTLLTIGICLFVSCSVERFIPEDETYAYVVFKEEATRDFTASNTPKSYDSLYWFYTAVKSDDLGKKGETSTQTQIDSSTGLGGEIGPFSQGTWKFDLFAYDKATGETLIYKTKESVEVTLTGGTSTVSASVVPCTTSGNVRFENAYFEYADGGVAAPSFEMVASRTDVENGATYTFTTESSKSSDKNTYMLSLGTPDNYGKCTVSLSASTSPELEAGIYKCVSKAYFKSGDTIITIGEGTFHFAVYGSADTVISGALDETATSQVKFDVAKQVIETKTITADNTDKKLTFGAAENVSGDDAKRDDKTDISTTTKVELDLSQAKTGSNNTTEITAVTLKTEIVTGTKAAESFVIEEKTDKTKEDKSSSTTLPEESKEAVLCSISLTATSQTGEEIGKSTKNNKGAGFGTNDSKAVTQTVTVFIGKGLNDKKNYSSAQSSSDSLLLKIYYGGVEESENIRITEYDANTGYLTFTTTHFSTFVVVDTSQYPVAVIRTVDEEPGNKETITYFESLAKAFSAAIDEDAIELKKNITTVPNEISSTKTISLCLNNYTIATGTQAPIVVKKGMINLALGEESGESKQKAAVIRGVKLGDTNLNGFYYPTVEAAYEEMGNNLNTLTLFGNTSLTGSLSEVAKDITIDLNGFILSVASGANLTVKSGKTLVIENATNSQVSFVKGFKVGGSGVNGTYYPTLQEAIEKLGKVTTVTMMGDCAVATDYIDIGGKTVVLDLNGYTLTASTASTTFEKDKPVGLFRLKNNSNLTVKNGSIISTSKNSAANEDYQTFRIRNDESGDSTGAVNAKLTLENVTMEAPSGITIKEHASEVNVTLTGSEIIYAEGNFGISTNAKVKTSDKVVISIEDSRVMLKKDGIESQDTTGLLVNVPAEVTIANSTFEGQRQGAVLRGGTYKIENSVFRSTGNKSNYYDSGDYLDSDWKEGNEVPLAAVVIGNRSGSYQYKTEVTFIGKNTLTVANAEETGKKQLYVYQNDTTNTVAVLGNVDTEWTENEKMHGADYPNMIAKIGTYHYGSLQEAINAAENGETIVLTRDAEGSGIGTPDSAETKRAITIDFAKHTYTVNTTPLVGSTGTENQAMHWGRSLSSITMKNGTFAVAENVEGLLFGMQNYVDFTANEMTFDFSKMTLMKYGTITGEWAAYSEKERPLFNNNDGKMTLQNCVVTMPSASDMGMSADGKGVSLENTRVNGCVNMQENGSWITMDPASSVKKVKAYFEDDEIVTTKTDNITKYELKKAEN